MAPNIIYKCKQIDFRGEKRNILYPKHGHSRTALLALANCLILKGSLTITPEEDNDYPLQSVIMRLIRTYSRKHSKIGGDHVITKPDMGTSVKFLSDLFDVDIGFTSNDSIRSCTGRLDMFEHFNVPLLHAWRVQPNDTVVFDAVGTSYHPVFKVEHSLAPNSDPLVQNFLNAGVTDFGINELQNITEEGEIFTLFKKGSFHTMAKHNGTLYLLNNVIGASDKDMWKEFNERDDGKIYNSNFVLEPMGENRSEDIQQAQAEVPSQTVPSVSERMHKCTRTNCQADFLSVVNLNRHKQVHSKNPQLKMHSFTKAEISEYWDQLSLEEAGKVLSMKEIKIQGVCGDLLCQVIEKVDNENEFYDRANKIKVVLDGTKKISSHELFTLLDEESENTAFSTDIHFCPEKIVFSLGPLLLRDFNDVFSCWCYFMEKNMVLSWLAHKTAEATKLATALMQESDNSHTLTHVQTDAMVCGMSGCTMQFTSQINFNRHTLTHVQTDAMDFMENIEAISKYWDNLTCDQTRQLMSLKKTKITGVNLKNLQRRVKKIVQNHPLAMTGKQLIDILSSSEKMTSTEMLDVLEKASENTHFANDIRHCKDDEIFAVQGDKCTPSCDVAVLSYIIERKLVEEWFHSMESVTSDIQGQLVDDKKSEQSDTVEPVSMREKLLEKSDTVEPVSVVEDKLQEKRDSTESKADQVHGVSKSQHNLNPTSGDSTESKADQVHGVSTSQHNSNPTSGILLEEFVKSNKLTKIYKIRPKDVFKVLKRSLKTLKKDFASKFPKKKLKAVFKLSTVILTRRGRKCARGFLLWIVKNHREGNSWNGSFQLSDMQVLNEQFIISKAADKQLTVDSASADF